ncbi:MAG TPA: ATP synthase F1 subunit delta [Planctomycetota bacterium]|nr:ATP synthase F1 subunit delta [Planctomycetota bacterium]
MRYAKALFGLAKDEHRVAEVRGELESLTGLFGESEELRQALLTPLHPADQRKAALRAVSARLSFSPLFTRFCSYLIDQRRLIDYSRITDEYYRLADEDQGLVTAEVVAAAPLDDRRRDRLRRALSARTGREVRLEVKVDPALLGGAIAKVGDLVFDGSIRTQLEHLRSALQSEAAGRS